MYAAWLVWPFGLYLSEATGLNGSQQRRLVLDSLVLGLVGAFAAQFFMVLLHLVQAGFLTRLAGYQPPGLPDEGGTLREVIGSHGLWLIPVATTLGGLISGILVYGLAPEAEGHGTDTVVKAFHNAAGKIRARIAPLKMVASAITIGSGGAAGREGPIALISAGIGSAYACLGRRSEDERRILVLIGMAAGLSAIFRSPIGAAVFAIEVLYRNMEFEARALLYAMLAAVVAYAANGPFVGWEPLFQVSAGLTVTSWLQYGWYALLGAASGIVGALLPFVFYGLRDAFRALPVAPHFKPAIGGLGVGLLALLVPQVLGGGYGWIQEAMDGRLTASLMLALLFAKVAGFSLTVSSGGSGGVFAPSLFVGAMLGGFVAQVFGLPPAGFVIVGMATVFAGAGRVPIATILMVAEMTGGYSLLAPTSLAVVISFLLQSALTSRLGYKSLYEAQVRYRSDSPAHLVEHLDTAMTLLRKRQRPVRADSNHAELVALLRDGVPTDLGGGKQLTIGELRPGSTCVGQAIRESDLFESPEDVELVAVIRKTAVLLANSESRLEPGDLILLVCSMDGRSKTEQHLASIGEPA